MSNTAAFQTAMQQAALQIVWVMTGVISASVHDVFWPNE